MHTSGPHNFAISSQWRHSFQISDMLVQYPHWFGFLIYHVIFWQGSCFVESIHKASFSSNSMSKTVSHLSSKQCNSTSLQVSSFLSLSLWQPFWFCLIFILAINPRRSCFRRQSPYMSSSLCVQVSYQITVGPGLWNLLLYSQIFSFSITEAVEARSMPPNLFRNI